MFALHRADSASIFQDGVYFPYDHSAAWTTQHNCDMKILVQIHAPKRPDYELSKTWKARRV